MGVFMCLILQDTVRNSEKRWLISCKKCEKQDQKIELQWPRKPASYI